MSGRADQGGASGSEQSSALDYPFEDFLTDLDALGVLGHLHDAPSHNFLRSALAHFRTRYSRQRVRLHRLIRFLLAVTYLDEHFHQFDTESLAVYGSDRTGGLASEALLRAIHQVFAVPDVFTVSNPPSPADVSALARSLQTEQAGPVHGPRAVRVRPKPSP